MLGLIYNDFEEMLWYGLRQDDISVGLRTRRG
jgi:hypothetical protein